MVSYGSVWTANSSMYVTHWFLFCTTALSEVMMTCLTLGSEFFIRCMYFVCSTMTLGLIPQHTVTVTSVLIINSNAVHWQFSWVIQSSSSRMCVIYHNWSATKQRPHSQSVAEISHHSVLSGDRNRQCGLATRTQISVCKLPFLSAATAVSLFHAKTVQQRPLLPREVETRLPDCGVAHKVRIDHLSRLPVMPPSTFDVNWLQVQPQRLPGCQS